MKQSQTNLAPYGSWKSPINAKLLVSGAVSISEVIPDGEAVWWAESRPEESGRVAIMRYESGSSVEVTPSNTNVRTLIHEYGGGSWWVQNNTLWFVDYADQRLRQMNYAAGEDSGIKLLSAEPEFSKAQRFAEMRPTNDTHWVICICESHSKNQKEPENQIVAVATDGSFKQITLCEGADFYGSLCISPDGNSLAWIEWDHPNMPWDTTTLKTAVLQSNSSGIVLKDEITVAGGHEEAIVQASFSPDNKLHYLSDRNDTWQLYMAGKDTAVHTVDGEIGYPPWVHGLSRYGFDEHGNVIAAHFKGGIDHLDKEPDGTSFSSVRTSGSKIAYASASWQAETSVHYNGEVVRASRKLGLSDDFFPAPEVLTYPTGKAGSGELAHA